MDVLTDPARRFLAATAPEHTETQAEMADLADEWGFPIIGPEAGAVLRLLARLTDADRAFEFGSGFGYSATWFLRGGAGHVVCTEFDADEAERGVSFAAEGGYADRVTFEVGDAMETVDRYDGPFDVVLIDHQKERYADAYRAVLPKVRSGGVVVADNIARGPIDFGDLVAHFEAGEPLPDAAVDAQTRGVGEYVGTVRSDDAVETAVLPVGSGISVSTVVR
ncbi:MULTISPECIES: O-methyltransferase [Halorubrum]|jgi:predicted O-methyltransferase YrrM|uniref:Methyltransferase n=1 Tax=Halorubrum tropicale TaxID=1765655 RepID=A0A0M9ART6_9EURY|nr:MULTISPECIES: O-methyltransferase [Halorubrum]KOX97018.1 methyltransferase [Halorubrum tropicale]RLM51551.1 O-methyltransferase [Halorubrum sp. Atlit-28R]TKX46148.1 O-methyltransferase [Halorubrum sp. ARQ200]TKX49274.1 O-methyltransferase [Halorubrum sp. ASP121]